MSKNAEQVEITVEHVAFAYYQACYSGRYGTHVEHGCTEKVAIRRVRKSIRRKQKPSKVTKTITL